MEQHSIEWLKKVRRTLKEEAAWSHASAEPVAEDEAGKHDDAEVQAEADEEDGNINDQIDMLLSGIVDALLEEYDLDEEEAFDFVLDVADVAAEEGMLPYLPDEDASDEELAAWYGQATTAGFTDMVLEAASDSAEE